MNNPYMMQMQQAQNLGGIDPYFQNIAGQQASQNAAMQQGQALTQAAGQIGQQGGGSNPMALAALLRKKPDQAGINAQDAQMGGLSTYNPLTQYNISQQYGTDPYSQSSRMLAAQERGF
jgi:hypothetical protein